MPAMIDDTLLADMQALLGADLHRLLQRFVSRLDSELAELQEARAAQDWEGVRRLAHSLKGSSGSIGAVGLSELAAKLEYAARAAALHEVDATLDALGRAAQETERALRRAGWLS